MLVACGTKRVSAENIEIWNVVGPAERIENSGPGIGAHARRADLMNHTAQRLMRLSCFNLAGSCGAVQRPIGRAGSARKADPTALAHAGHCLAARTSKKLLGRLLEVL